MHHLIFLNKTLNIYNKDLTCWFNELSWLNDYNWLRVNLFLCCDSTKHSLQNHCTKLLILVLIRSSVIIKFWPRKNNNNSTCTIRIIINHDTHNTLLWVISFDISLAQMPNEVFSNKLFSMVCQELLDWAAWNTNYFKSSSWTFQHENNYSCGVCGVFPTRVDIKWLLLLWMPVLLVCEEWQFETSADSSSSWWWGN